MRARPLPVSALATMLALLPAISYADSVYWNGGTSNDWATDTNWSWDGHAPAAGDSALIDGGTVAPVLNGTSTMGSLVVGGAVTGSLQVNGTLNASSIMLGNSAGANGSVTVAGSGVLGSANLNSSSTLYVGQNGNASLTLDNGARAGISGDTYIGGDSGGNGSLTLTNGAGFFGANLTVGNPGASGTVDVNGSAVTLSGNATFAAGAGSGAHVTLDGGSQWNAAGGVTVGSGGSAALNIQGGSTLIDANGVIGTAASNATVNVSGSASQWTNNVSLIVGATGNGTLTISAGGNVSSANTIIGRQGSSNSSVAVSGIGSSLAAGNLTIGGDAGSGASGGKGLLGVSDGATAGAALVHLGDTNGGNGTLNVSNATFTATDRLSIGYANGASGRMNVSSGAIVSDTGALVGHLAGSAGFVTVSGSGSQWRNSGVVYVGNEGNGFLTIAAGGNVTSTDGYVGTETGSASSATITGSGSTWSNSGDLFIGHNNGASGTVVVINGGTLSNAQGILGDLAGSTGTLQVSGAGSSWTSSGDLNVGRFGNGTLNIAAGAQVTGNRIYIANEANSNGTVSLSGTGSSWTSNSSLHVGGGGNGTLTISDGATVTATVINIATQAGATGVLNVGAEAGSAAAAAGNLNTTTIAFGAGNGTLNLNHDATDSASYTLGATFSGSGTINQLAGSTVFAGLSSGFTGTTNIDGGKLSVDGSLGGSINVNSGGTLSGSGAVGATTVAAGGTLATAGTSTLTVNGNLDLLAGSTYVVTATPVGAGSVAVNGNAVVQGALLVKAGNSAFSTSSPYTILSATGTLSGNFTGVSSDFAFVTPSVSYVGNTAQLTLTRNDTGYASVASSPNQATVANALSQASSLSSTTAAFRTVLSQIDTLSTSQAQAAFDSMSGRAYQGLSTLGLMGQSLQTLGQRNIGSAGVAGGFGTGLAMSKLMFASADIDRFDYQYSAAATMTDSSNGVGAGTGMAALPVRQTGGLWAQVSGGHGNTRSDGNAAGYTSNSNGMLVGLDRVINDQWSAGVAYHYDNTRLAYSTVGDSAKVQGHQLAGYGRYQTGPWSFKGILGYGRNQYGTERSIVIGSSTTRASGDYHGDELGLYLEGSYRIERQGYSIEPLLSLQGTLLRQDSFSETGAGALGLDAAAQSSRSAVSMLGARWHIPLMDGKLQSELRAFWSHQWLDAGGTLRASFQGAPGVNFQVAGLQQKRDGLVLGAGVAGKVGRQTSLFLDYNLGLNDLQTLHSVVAGLNMKW